MKILVSGILAGAYALAMVASAEERGSSALWPRHTIDSADKSMGKLGADGVRLADADSDGLLDVVTGWENGDAIRVCLNPGPEKTKEPWPGFTVGRVAGAEDAVFCDLDADGVLDVVSCTEGKTRTVFVHWAPHPGGGYSDSASWKTESVPVLKQQQMWMYCLPFDVNADGRDDLILGSKNEGATVGWLEQPTQNPRDLSTWRYHSLYEAGWIMSIRADDLDGDGDLDVIFSDRKGNSTGVWWLRNEGKAGAPETGSIFAKPERLGLEGEEVMFVDVADIDGDGRLDIAAAIKPDRVALLRQPKDGVQGAWRESVQMINVPQDRFGTAKAVRVADLDLDGNVDLAVTCENAMGKLSGCFAINLSQTDGKFQAIGYRDISGSEGVKYDRMELLDLDGDGDLDLMTCEERTNLGVFWYENPAR
ncbi:MAG: VCBS repeat-containing protein [Verrucomicrobiae bacterium]|nr:VCBS repeat-containing protein [Verrucomicrobiae bacterium]